MKINCVIIGYGSIGKKHYKNLKKIKEVNKIFIISSHRKGKNFYKDLNDIKKFNIDYFIICNETYKHHKYFLIIEKNFSDKIVLIEKPVFHKYFITNLRLKNQYFVGYNLRFHPVINKLKNLIKGEQILNIDIKCNSYLPNWRKRYYKNCYSVTKNQGGGVGLDLSHELDYLIYIFGDIKKFSILKQRLTDLTINSEDFFNINGYLLNKSYFNINLNYFSMVEKRYISVDMKSKSVLADLIANEIIIQTKNKSKIIKFNNKEVGKMYYYMHLDILKSKKKCANLKEGLKVLKIYEG